MGVTHLHQDIPDVPRHQRELVEAAKLVCKLRWIGKEDEARVSGAPVTKHALG